MIHEETVATTRISGFTCDKCLKQYNNTSYHTIKNQFYCDAGDAYGEAAELCGLCIREAIKILKQYGVKFRNL